MSKKRLLAIIVWSATLAATGAIADVTHTPSNPQYRGVAAQRDAEDAAFRRLYRQSSDHENIAQSGGSDRRASA